RLGDDAGHVFVLERRFQRGDIVELDDLRRLGQVAEFARQSRPVDCDTIDQPYHRLVDRAVITAVEDQDFFAAGDGASNAQREAVGVGGGGGDLPEWQAEALLQQRPDGQRVL